VSSPTRAPLASIPLPKLVVCLRQGYPARLLAGDLLAGVTVGLVALPLAMAFAIASGLPPQNGLYCAVIAGFIISALGGSRVQIGGPTGAFVVVVSGIVAAYGIEGLFMCTLMAGVILVLLGITGLGTAVKYIPRPVVIGFTNGIAILIASTQIRDVFGLQTPALPGEFLARMRLLVSFAGTASGPATLLAAMTIAIVLGCRWVSRRIPGSIVALVAGSAVAALAGLPVDTIGSRFGTVPGGVPVLHLPTFRPDLVLTLLAPALTVAMLGAIESLLSAVVADRMSGDRHDPNVELTAQGIANILSPLFGGLPATGAIARTATNVRAGARTPVAGIVHALTLLVILLAAAPLAASVPMAVLAGILLVVSFNMGEWHEVPALWKQRWADPLVWLATFTLTILADLTVAVEVGMILAALLFISRVAATTTVSRVTQGYVDRGRPHILQDKSIPDYVTVLRIHGPFLFGSTDKLSDLTSEIAGFGDIVVLRLRNMTALDATGLHAIEDFADALHASGRTLLLCGALPQPAALMDRAEFHRHVGAENVLPHVDAALARARAIHDAGGLKAG
jgi:SulP family sulfate permease